MKIKILKKDTLQILINKVVNAIWCIEDEFFFPSFWAKGNYHFIASLNEAFINQNYISFTISIDFCNDGDYINLYKGEYEYSRIDNSFIIDLFPHYKKLKRQLIKLTSKLIEIDENSDSEREKFTLNLINLAYEFRCN